MRPADPPRGRDRRTSADRRERLRAHPSLSPGTHVVVLSAVLLLAATLLVAPAPPAHAVDREPAIVYMRENYTARIYVSNRDGTWKEPLTGTGSDAALPRWSPQGGRILYTRTPFDGWTDSDLMVMGPRGGNKTVLLPGMRRNWIHDMAWAPGGGRVVLVMTRDEVHDLWMYKIATGELRPLGVNDHPGRHIETVDWSSQGEIAFSAIDWTSDQEDTDLYLVQPDGSGLEQLSDTPARPETRPRFSADGSQLVYTTVTDSCLHLVVANADLTDRQRVRTGCRTWEGAWSRDARRLLVKRYSWRKNDYEIWDTNVDGSSKWFVVTGEDASWRPGS